MKRAILTFSGAVTSSISSKRSLQRCPSTPCLVEKISAVYEQNRQDALAACKDAIDILKVDVPLWKKEVYEGGEEWIGRGS